MVTGRDAGWRSQDRESGWKWEWSLLVAGKGDVVGSGAVTRKTRIVRKNADNVKNAYDVENADDVDDAQRHRPRSAQRKAE